MTANKDDKLLHQLYQQRKESIKVPQVNLQATSPARWTKSIFTRLTVALVGGSVASFGVLAIITFLAKAPALPKVPVVDIKANTDLELKQTDDSELAAQAVAKAMAKINRQLPKKEHIPERENLTVQSVEIALPSISHNELAKQLFMDIKQPPLTVKLIHQVLPTFPDAALNAGLSGYVKIAYQITSKGRVDDIEVISSNARSDIQKAAISALNQWRYLMQGNNAQSTEIIFEFKKPN